jgi:hypothetical protein
MRQQWKKFPREANLNCVASQHGWQTAAFLQQIEKCGSLPGSRYAVFAGQRF